MLGFGRRANPDIIKAAMKGLTTMRQIVRRSGYPSRTEVETLPFSHKIQEISQRVKIIRFGVVREAAESPWDRLAGMFTMSKPVQIERMLHARGDEETAEDL